MKKITC